MKTFFSRERAKYLLGLLVSFAVFFGLLLSYQVNAEEVAVGIRHKIAIEGGVVKLQDIFTNIENSRYKDRIVIESPPPGERTILPARWLARLAESYRIAWKPLTRFDEVEVVRESRLVEEEELKYTLSSNINRKIGGNYEYAVEFDNGSRELHLPANMLGEIVLSRLSYTEQNGRFTALVEISGAKNSRGLPIRGFAHRIIQLPVLSRSMSKGEIIKGEDISHKKIRWNHVPRGAIVHADDLKGMALRSRVQGDNVLRQNQIEKPILIRSKNLILVELLTARMTVKLRAQAMENGHMGEVIRVRNLKSKKVFEAEVTGLKKARIIVDDSDVAYLP